MPTKAERVASPLDEVLAGLKSAVTIDDPEQIGKLLSERVAAVAKAKPGLAHTWVQRDAKSGKTNVYKASAKSDPTGMLGDGAPALESSAFPELARLRGLEWQAEYQGRVVPYWCSDERVDSQGDIVRQSWIFDLFEKNPVWPISHDWSGLPVANGIDWRVLSRRGADYSGPALWMLGLFATREQYEFADKVFRLVKAGFLRAGSVGFVSDKLIDIRDEDERQKLGLGRYGVILEDNHLLEFSPCTLGANPGAHSLLSQAKARGELQPIDLEVARELERSARRRARDEGAWRDEDRQFVAMAKLLFPRTKFRDHREVEAPFEEFQEGTLRGYEPPVEEKIDAAEFARLEGKIDALAASVADGMVGLAAMLEDVRTIVEGGGIAETLALAEEENLAKIRDAQPRPKSILQILRDRDLASEGRDPKPEVVASG